MRSIRDSFSRGHTLVPSVEKLPKSAGGILPHAEEVKFNELWIELCKAEEAFRTLHSEVYKYQNAILDVQECDEKLVKAIEESRCHKHSDVMDDILVEQGSISAELKPLSKDTSHILNELYGEFPRQYHSIYEHIDQLRRNRDFWITEYQRIQEKIDKLKLKGKRTTDAIVEKERVHRQLSDVNSLIVKDGRKFHEMRGPYLDGCVKAGINAQSVYYSQTASCYNGQVGSSRSFHMMKESDYADTISLHLDRIRELKIVDK